MKTVLLMGGTGAMGMYLVPLLLKKGYKVYVTTRSERHSNHKNLIYLIGNAKNINWLLQISTSQHYDAIFDFMMYSNSEFEKVCEKLLSLTNQYFYLSSYRAYADETGDLTENCKLKIDTVKEYPEYRIDRYGLNKGYQENVLRNSKSLNWTIIRPAMTYGKNRIQWFAGDNFDVIRAARGVVTALPESVFDTPNNIAYGKDVALMLEALIGKEKAFGEAFHTTTEVLTWGEMIEVYYQVFGMRVMLVSDEDYKESIDSDDGRIVDRFKRRKFVNRKILNVTGLEQKNFHRLKDGLLEVWRESDKEKYLVTGTGAYHQAKFDALTNSITSAKFIPQNMRTQFGSIRQNSFFKEEIFIDKLRVRVINDYWRAIQGEQSISLIRTSKSSKGPIVDNRWINFELNKKSDIKKNESYRLQMIIVSNAETHFQPFIHHFGINAQMLDKVHLLPGLNTIEIVFRAKRDDFTDFSITATDFSTNITLRFEKILFEKVL